jgi:NNP family nitrate/nitrite transporter-like MFS transporter
MSKTIITEKAEKINIFSFGAPHMRAFHITWLSFMVCFFAWFAIAPLMAVVRDEFHLTKSQIGNIIIASVSITIVARLFVGWLCDRIGPRLTYTWLLLIGAIPVICIGFAKSYEAFLIFRLSIGIIGASFVITQYHTSAMFAGKVVGSANAIAGGWGNLGGGLAQMIMPLFFAGFIAIGATSHLAWRYSMIIPGVAMLLMAFLYYRYTQDTPEGNIPDLRKQSIDTKKEKTNIKEVLADRRVWILFLIYGCSFGMEITIDNIAALYFIDKFGVNLATAGLLAGTFGAMNLFARALGGIFSDKVSKQYGLRGRTSLLGLFLFVEGIGVMIFSQIDLLIWSVITMISFALFVKMSNGACYSVVPFINKKALGMVAGIVGAGGNVGAILMGFVFKMEGFTYQSGLFLIGGFIVVISLSAFLIQPLYNAKVVAEKESEFINNEVNAELVSSERA